jgi:hypothetical protein
MGDAQLEAVMAARAAAVSSKPRFEVFEHNGHHYAVRQQNTRIAKLVNKHVEPQSRILEGVIQCTHLAVPIMGTDGKQSQETVTENVLEPVLDENGKPVLAPILDPNGRPVVNPETTQPYMRAETRPKMGEDGKPVTVEVTRQAWDLGPLVFDKTVVASLEEEPNDEDSFIGKATACLARLNDREIAKARAKKF